METYSYTGDEFREVYRKNIKSINELMYFDNTTNFYESENVNFFIVKIDNNIAGIAHIRKSPYIDNTYWLSYLSVNHEYQNRGVASKLSDFVFRWFKDNNIQFESSSYTEEGFLKLKPLFNKLAVKYDVDFIDKGKF